MKQWPLVRPRFRAIAAWPLLVQDVFLQRIGALVLLAAISASAWNLLGGYAGQVSVGHAVYFGAGAYSLAGRVYPELGWPPIAGAPVGVPSSRWRFRALVGHADLPPARPLFLHGHDRGGRVVPHPRRQLAAAGRGGRPDGTAGAAHRLGPVVHQPAPVPLPCSWPSWSFCWR